MFGGGFWNFGVRGEGWKVKVLTRVGRCCVVMDFGWEWEWGLTDVLKGWVQEGRREVGEEGGKLE